MTADAVLTLVVVLAVLAALASDLAPPPLVLLGAVAVLLLLDVVDAAQAFAGFSNPAPITVAALYVVARAVEETGVLTALVGRVMATGSGRRRQLARIVVPTAAASAFLNNTPIVAMVAPAVTRWAEQHDLPPSRFLIPISYATILGGVVTAIGTSTTLVVSGLLEAEGQPPLSLLAPLAVGGPVALAGLAALLLLAPRLVPERPPVLQQFREGVREFTVTVRVKPGGPLDGRDLVGAGLRALKGVFAVRLLRGDEVIAPVAPDQVLRGGDELTFVGNVAQIMDLQRLRGLESTEAHHLERLGGGNGQQFVEAVVGPSSPVVGRTLKEVGFRGRYGAAVVAVHRAGHRLEGKLGEIPLRVGDTLLLLAGRGFVGRWRESGDFALIAGLDRAAPMDAGKARITLLVVIGLLVAAGTGLLSILEASLLAALTLVGTRVMTSHQARTAVDLSVVVVIAAAFGLGAAVESSGLAHTVADALLAVAGPFGAVGVVLAVLLLTQVLTELVTNNAAAVLAFPIAVAAAPDAGLDPRGLAIGVAVAASLSFVTPIGYQTNLMVYGLGGYRFGDFARAGAPVALVGLLAATGATLWLAG